MATGSKDFFPRRKPSHPGSRAAHGSHFPFPAESGQPGASTNPAPPPGTTTKETHDIVRGEVTVRIHTDSDILNARKKGKLLAAETGFGSSDVAVLSTLISGFARRMKPFHGEGSIVIQALQRGTRKGIAVSLAIHPEPRQQPPPVTRSSWTPANLALDDRLRSLAQRRVTDEFDLWPTGHPGTVVRAVKWL